MFKENKIIIALFMIALVSFLLYIRTKNPDGVTPQSDQIEIAKYAFWTAVASFVTAFIGLVKKILDLIMKTKDE